MTYQKMELILAPQPLPEEPQEPLKQISKTQSIIQESKKQLHQLMQAMSLNTSLFSRAACFWSQIPLWQKIMVGALLILPLLIIGILAGLASLIILGLLLGLAYTLSDFLLKNHQKHNVNNLDGFKTCISNLVDVLDSVILNLDTLCHELGEEINKMHQENGLFSTNIAHLSAHNQTLAKHLDDINHTKTGLMSAQEELSQVAGMLSRCAKMNDELIKKSQKKLKQIAQHSKSIQAEQDVFEHYVNQLQATIVDMMHQLEEMTNTVNTLSYATGQNKKEHAFREEQLKSFINSQEELLEKKSENLSRTCDALPETLERFEQIHQKHKQQQAAQAQFMDNLIIQIHQSQKAFQLLDIIKPGWRVILTPQNAAEAVVGMEEYSISISA